MVYKFFYTVILISVLSCSISKVSQAKAPLYKIIYSTKATVVGKISESRALRMGECGYHSEVFVYENFKGNAEQQISVWTRVPLVPAKKYLLFLDAKEDVRGGYDTHDDVFKGDCWNLLPNFISIDSGNPSVFIGEEDQSVFLSFYISVPESVNKTSVRLKTINQNGLDINRYNSDVNDLLGQFFSENNIVPWVELKTAINQMILNASDQRS